MAAVPAAVRFAFPRVTVPSVNVTLPVMVAAPAITFTVAVMASAVPAIPGFGTETTVVDVWVTLTVCVMEPEVTEMKLLLPGQDALMV